MLRALKDPNPTSFFIARQPDEIPAKGAPFCVVLGNLDGLHQGHQELLRVAKKWATPRGARTLVFTFDPHPMDVLPGKPAFLRIFPVRIQSRLIQAGGVDGVYYQNFSADFAKTTAEDFLKQYLVPITRPAAIVVGFNFRFGQNRQGTPEFLTSWGQRNGVEVIVVPPFELDGQPVSSSLIRTALQNGDVGSAGKLLGFPFFIDGKVEPGAQRGRGLGFPTANVHWGPNLVPAFGVYVTRTWVQGSAFPSVSHLGPVPTFGEVRPRLETHILDQELSLYGEELRVEFLQKLRDPVKFAGLEELKSQIQKDIAHSRAFHQSRPESE